MLYLQMKGIGNSKKDGFFQIQPLVNSCWKAENTLEWQGHIEFEKRYCIP